jgi:hypothetical protein
MEASGPDSTFMNMSHWGAYRVHVRNDRMIGITPFERDPEPSPLIGGMADVVHHPCRVARTISSSSSERLS